MVPDVVASAVAVTDVHAPREGPTEPDPLPQPAAPAGRRSDELAFLLNHTPNPTPGQDVKVTSGPPPQLTQTFAKFFVDGTTHEVRIQIFDATTGTMVREVPPENLAQMAGEGKVYQGLLLDHQA